MKRLLLILISILLLGIMGLFATQNNHSVNIKIFENFSIQLSVWILILVVFLSGWGLTEIWQFFSHPNRFVQRLFFKFSRHKEEKKRQLKENFKFASLLRDSKQITKNYKKLDEKNIPLSIRVKYLGQLRYENNKEKLLIKFAGLRDEYQGNLEVLLPYLKLTCEVFEWDLAEKLSKEILLKYPSHPDALMALRNCYIVKKDWISCIMQEKCLLEKLGECFFTENLTFEHEFHLEKALLQDPNCLKNWSFGYLAQKRDRKNDQKLQVIGESIKLEERGSFLEAGIVLKKFLGKNYYSELLDKLENIYIASGKDEKILKIVRDLHNPRKPKIKASILLAKLLYKNNKLDEASKVLNEIQSNVSASSFKNENTEQKIEDQERNEQWVNLFHALRFFIAIHEDRSEIALKEAKVLLREDRIF